MVEATIEKKQALNPLFNQQFPETDRSLPLGKISKSPDVVLADGRRSKEMKNLVENSAAAMGEVAQLFADASKRSRQEPQVRMA